MPEKPSPTPSVTLSRRRLVVIVSIVGTVVVAVAVTGTLLLVGNDGSSTPTAAGGKSRTCTWTSTGNPAKLVKPPPTTVPTNGTVTVAVTTSQGPMTFTLDRAAAPCTVASFLSLAGQRYFDDSPCTRVTTSGIWVIQCGDPTGYGSGEPGYAIPDEATGNEQYPAGTLAMARTAAPNSGGSQFFVVYQDSPSLRRHLGTRQYTVFGTVLHGLPVARKVGAAGAQTGHDGRPKLPLQLLFVAGQ
ncbi:MAG: peptidyl-prolyl cis-trans isomerase [Pseudonocardiales bacterium]|nr:peptidyl-prolyl cis-trans isomerase [Pseudonocardiales bacterium]